MFQVLFVFFVILHFLVDLSLDFAKQLDVEVDLVVFELVSNFLVHFALNDNTFAVFPIR